MYCRLEGLLSQCYTDSEGTLVLSITLASVELANSSLGFIKSPRSNSMTENQLNVFFWFFSAIEIFCDCINLYNVTDTMCFFLL